MNHAGGENSREKERRTRRTQARAQTAQSEKKPRTRRIAYVGPDGGKAAAPEQNNAARRPAPAKPARRTANAEKAAQEKRASVPVPRRGFGPRRKKQAGSAPQVKIYPLGGLGEVGKNITLYECGDDMLLVDCGLVFPDSDMFGVDLVIPDFSFVLQNRSRIRGLIITHGHEDHIGSLPYLLREFNVPVYSARLTLGLIRNKLEEHGLASSAQLNEIMPGRKFKLGCFTIEPIHVNHSIPDALAFAIECPAGVILHTGDFKIDYTPISGGPTDLAAIAAYGKKGVLALLSDSTNAERPGFTATEHKVGESFASLFRRAEKKRIVIATFASNVYRIQQIIDLAVAAGRKVAVSGRSMVNNTAMAHELGYLHAPEGAVIDIEEINKYPPEKIVLITTGSQGEPLSALSRMASASHRNVRIGEGDFIIISANPIPGNEKMVTKVVNGLLKLGAEVIYESMYDVHVSGHACQEEQKLMLTLANPQFFLPVHGEYKQLKKHAMTALAVGVPSENIYIGENGDCIILSADGIRLGEPVTAGAVMVDGLGVGDVGSAVLRDRRHLSEDGLVIVVVTVDGASGTVLSGPELVSRGFVYVRESEELLDGARAAVRETLAGLDRRDMRDHGMVKTRLRETVSSYLYRKTKRSPMILPIIMQV
ncbi:MAG TPA: ribonuclease J [Candidatus Ruthenibacterium merdigallinarum]|nr:ribonuclease J [Candidatus Ruthenibacterium merdigallinarum]